jgi:2-dehydropantoate 2-reductase
MRVLVLGAGALGGYFGGKLQKSGVDVSFLVRPRRAAQLAEQGLVLKAQDGEIRLPAKTVMAGQVEGPYDVVLLCCKAYDLDGAIEAVAPAIGPGTAVLPFLNGIRHLSALSDRLGPGAVVGGVTAVNAVLEPSGDVVQSPVKIDMTALGELDGARSARCAAIQRAFTAAAVPIALRDDILAFMWAKFFLFAAIATLATLTQARAGAIARSAAVSWPRRGIQHRVPWPRSSAASTRSATPGTGHPYWWTCRRADRPRASIRSATWSSARRGAACPRRFSPPRSAPCRPTS